eukprot:Ihof_evm3s159 gene=Ihof_evmTU3s159
MIRVSTSPKMDASKNRSKPIDMIKKFPVHMLILQEHKEVTTINLQLEPLDVMVYQSLIDGLLWIPKASCSDCQVAVSYLARCTGKPTKIIWKRAMHLLSYFRATADESMVYEKTSLTLTAFSNMYWATDLHISQSTLGYVICLARKIIDWLSKKQSVTALYEIE